MPKLNLIQCIFSSCIGPEDDPYRPCFECEGIQSRKVYGDAHFDNYLEYDFLTSRQSNESFQATRQSKRVVCGTENGNRRCRLRISRAIQLRGRSYARTQDFIQREQYLSEEDVELIIRYLFQSL